LTIGTSGAVRITTEAPIYEYPAMIFSYVLDKGKYVCGGPVNNGGNVVQWLLKKFMNKTGATDADYALLFEQVKSVVPGSDGLLFLPYLYGERAPVWDEEACGAFIGIRDVHSDKHFQRAALEGICYSLNEVLRLLENASGPVHQINVSGGFTHSPVWVQMLADVTGKKFCLTGKEDASALGAAMLGWKGVGKGDEVYNDGISYIEPNASAHAYYQRMFPVFPELYRALKVVMHELQPKVL